ncbi:NAD(P)H-dependent oxidoreductase subunit E [Leptospira bourretii]|uniref:NAD(P)H-dependent oxidoreductase subunit E n=2 Tax=Leptospira TaxID=171 RepID=A0A4R9ILH4_9LEPT|nr:MULTISPECIES: NAD(P)H-dependent oxidoreductase subunit E [Leptospira]MCG6141265.1 NAD(P)H-dependent oxidoreductase subunit E [Leptospira mtsangambouensis]TGK85064.1 NAD(P)H-dependent oxidoreductase subunit E [Leptospira bourretii]TGK90830.1 NAD(P)H-dependent oxidoreductase subunit E [Leptospira bourretii]TGL23434.1 NAD(P)H-dependent oxidoreductase subunit E [Leptospira bourretii]TGL39590.1 NAD(P)H-dependent oxidoreductase subunit E [Leptospira bourretii]
MAYQFSQDSEKRFQRLIPQFPSKRSLILPCLFLLQADKGFVDQEGMQYIADRIGDPVSLAHVHGVATFYTMYNKKPVGKLHIQICGNISCYLAGSDSITEHVCSKLGIEPGETTSDKKFTVDEVQCLGACGFGPVAQINDKYYENLTPESIEAILSELEKQV